MPRRSRSPSLALDANKGTAASGFTFGTNSPARFSFAIASDCGSAVMVERDVPDVSSAALAETMAKLTCSSPAVAAVSAIFTIEKEASLPAPSSQRLLAHPTPVKLPTERLSFLPKQPSPTPAKQRTWSFTHHSNSRTRRRSRSVSPPPSRGTARDVLFRLRSARNWFWSALSGVGSGGSSAARHGRAGKGSRWGPLRSPLVSLAA